MKKALEMETKWGAAFRRNAYVTPKIEIFAVEQQLLLGKQSFEGGHDPGTPGNDELEAKEFGFGEPWDGDLWDF